MPSNATVTTRQQRLNVRSGPSIGHSIIGKLNKGQAVVIGDQVFSEGGWTWVDYNGGWVCQKDPRYSYPFLNITGAVTQPAPPQPEPAPPPTPNYDAIAQSLMDQFNQMGSHETAGTQNIPIDGSAVIWDDEKYDANKSDINQIWKENKYKGMMSKDELKALDRMSPEYMQNKQGFPPIERFDKNRGYYIYNYYMDYEKDNLTSDLQGIRNILNIGVEGRDELFRKYTEYYNRFKIANPNDGLSKTFAHVFFVRPDLNILNRKGNNWELARGVEKDPNFYYAHKKSPELLRQLISDGGYGHDFMMYLSNKAQSFSLSDESINHDTYGKALTGHKIAYGKSNIESKTSGDFTINYKDDRDLHIFHLHKLWVDYISNVYQGTFTPKMQYMLDRELDYATCLYYFLCAEDGETIIFWSKYYGVFPVTIPSSQYSWAHGNVLSNPEFDVRYQYSFKMDYNPITINEFNRNSQNKNNLTYIPIIDKEKYMTNTTWVGAPFVEVFNNQSLAPYTMKLRFRKE